jgi:zinc transporter 1/2/3
LAQLDLIDFGVFWTVWTSKVMALQAGCSSESNSDCRDEDMAFRLKMVAIVSILLAGAFGIALPLLGRRLMALNTDGPCFVLIKAFAAGVILATGFVHILPDATDALTDSCLPDYPWQDFPFSGFIAMMAALGTLMVDVMGTEYYEKKHTREREEEVKAEESIDSHSPNDAVDSQDTRNMHVVGVHAHAAAHSHNLESGMILFQRCNPITLQSLSTKTLEPQQTDSQTLKP